MGKIVVIGLVLGITWLMGVYWHHLAAMSPDEEKTRVSPWLARLSGSGNQQVTNRGCLFQLLGIFQSIVLTIGLLILPATERGYLWSSGMLISLCLAIPLSRLLLPRLAIPEESPEPES